VQWDFKILQDAVAGGQTHLAKLEIGLGKRWCGQVGHVVVEITGDSGVWGDGGGLETEVVIVLLDFFLEIFFADGNGDRQIEREFGAGGGFDGEEAALHVVGSGGRNGGVVGGDEVDAGVVETDGLCGIIGDDDADGQQAVLEVVEASVGAGVFGVAGFGGDSDAVMLNMHGILRGGQRWFGLVCGVREGRKKQSQYYERQAARHTHRLSSGLYVSSKKSVWQSLPARLAGMLMLLYSALLTMVIAVLALRSSVWLLRHPPAREGMDERFGRVRPELVATVAGRKVIWVHAVSVGEVLAATRLVSDLRDALGEGWEIVVSTTTLTGQALARKRFGAERVFPMPIDFGFSMRAYLNALKPAAIVLIESEVWPRMMHECRKRGIPVVVVNARVSDKSFKRSLKVRWIWSRVLRRATLWLAQSDEDARRLVEMGAPAEAVKVGGNLKYDVRAPKESRIAELIKEAAAGRPTVVAGSTVNSLTKNDPDEEELIIRSWKNLMGLMTKNGERTNALLVLAPRHPERFEAVQRMAEDGAKVSIATKLLMGSEDTLRPDIILLNTVGDLAAVYGVADIAFVGGSLIRRGGHNPLEPAQFGVPVVVGPSYENFRDVVEKMRAAEGILITNNTDEFEATLLKLLMDPAWTSGWGERGRKVFEEQQGATKRAVDAIFELVKP